MTQYLIKLVISTAIIVAVSEVSKRSSLFGGLLTMLWLYRDTKDGAKVAALSMSIFWLVLPSLVFFLKLPALLKTGVNFYASFGAATAIMLTCYGLMLLVLRKFNVSV